jgi:hypothetical protein
VEPNGRDFGGRDGRGGPGRAGRSGLSPALPMLVRALRNAPPEEFDLSFSPGKPEARGMAMELRQALESAGWTCTSMTPDPNAARGLMILSPHPSKGAGALLNWAKNNGVTAELRAAPRMPRVRILVGHEKQDY